MMMEGCLFLVWSDKMSHYFENDQNLKSQLKKLTVLSLINNLLSIQIMVFLLKRCRLWE